MRQYHFSPESAERLADLKTTDAEFDSINSQVAALARNPKLGYRIPFLIPSLDHSRKLFRFDVGRFGLIYTYDRTDLDVITVVA
jgi:mRNA-degrading endonuclease RelE of RelBE toxin-antitoxin system